MDKNRHASLLDGCGDQIALGRGIQDKPQAKLFGYPDGGQNVIRPVSGEYGW